MTTHSWTDPRDGTEWEVWVVTHVPSEPDRSPSGAPGWIFFRCEKKRHSAETALGDWKVDELVEVQLQVLLDRARGKKL
ncbi:MAG: hypothetical protein KAJ42_11250 [Gemmatimonadetes bacterium]|nr:hypothetical protein [Gemmatimonadota bacterium]